MGHYISQTGSTSGDLTNALSNDLILQLFSDGTGVASTTAIADVITRAEAVVDAYLTGVYTVPITPVNDILKTIVVDLACAYAYDRKPEFYRQDGKNPMAERVKLSMDLLAKLRSGEIRLGTETAEAPATGGGVVYGVASGSYFICDPNEGSSGPTGGF